MLDRTRNDFPRSQALSHVVRRRTQLIDRSLESSIGYQVRLVGNSRDRPGLTAPTPVNPSAAHAAATATIFLPCLMPRPFNPHLSGASYCNPEANTLI